MGAPIEHYVDPTSGDNSDNGLTAATARLDLQFAMDNLTRNATHGDRINMKAGATDEVLAAELDFSTYGTPTRQAPFIIQGYTTAEGDGGIGGIDCNAGQSLINVDGRNAVHIIDMHIHNAGARVLIRMGTDCIITRCELEGMTGAAVAVVRTLTGSLITNNYVHSFTGVGIEVTGGEIAWNFIDKSQTGNTAVAIQASGANMLVHHNLIKLSGSANTAGGILLNSSIHRVFCNSIWSNAGTGSGIEVVAGNDGFTIYNNVIEGFSATGGIGIETPADATGVVFSNAVNDCATAYSLSHDEHGPYTDNETLTSTPFADVTATTHDFSLTGQGNTLDGGFLDGTFPGPSGVPTNSISKGGVSIGVGGVVGGGGGGGFPP